MLFSRNTQWVLVFSFRLLSTVFWLLLLNIGYLFTNGQTYGPTFGQTSLRCIFSYGTLVLLHNNCCYNVMNAHISNYNQSINQIHGVYPLSTFTLVSGDTESYHHKRMAFRSVSIYKPFMRETINSTPRYVGQSVGWSVG